MAFGAVRCDTCGAEAPSLGSLQVHELRYHSGSAAAAAAAAAAAESAAARSAAPTGSGRRRAVAPLALAIGGLLSGGAFVVTIRLVG